jgi:hypothetical protein
MAELNKTTASVSRNGQSMALGRTGAKQVLSEPALPLTPSHRGAVLQPALTLEQRQGAG